MNTEPCWCEGPWLDVEPDDRPETTLGREHRLGDSGCIYADPPESEWTARDNERARQEYIG